MGEHQAQKRRQRCQARQDLHQADPRDRLTIHSLDAGRARELLRHPLARFREFTLLANQPLPRGNRVHVGTGGSLEQILNGPSTDAEGTSNLIGALKRSMATTGSCRAS